MVESGRWLFENFGIQGIRSIAYYFITINFFYMLLLVLAIFSVRKRRILKPFWKQFNALNNSPSISILAPAFNEELSIEHSVQALCHLRYSNYQVIVINDGSQDQTLSKLKNKFDLYETVLPRWTKLSKSSPRTMFRSRLFSNLIVIDKENSGKADSLNLGMDFSSTELVCCVDSDSLLETTALTSITAPFLEDPSTIAAGGTIRVVNGSRVEFAQVVERRYPKDFLSRIQFLEYTRAFFCGRVGWNSINSTVIISGAFGVFKKAAIIQVGGYQTDTLGEDMDLVVRLHAYHRLNKLKYRIVFLPDPICWTEVPTDWRTLKKQRVRWTVGLAQVLWKSKRLMLNPKYGAVGLIAMPYFLLVDLLSPFVEFLALILIIWGVLFGYFSSLDEILLLFVSITYGVIVTFAGALIDDSYDENKQGKPSLSAIFIYSILENFGYRQLHAWWRIQGFFKTFSKSQSWGTMVRRGTLDSPPSQK